MTVTSTSRKSGPYTGTGLVSAYPFDFKVFVAAEVRVTRTNLVPADSTLTLTTDYTVALNGDQETSPGGTVTLVAPLAEDYRLTITSNVEATQGTDITNSGGFYPDVVETAFDKLTIIVQQGMEVLSRAVILPISKAVGVNTQLDRIVPNGVLAWDATGENLICTTPESLATNITADDVRAVLITQIVGDEDFTHAPSADAVKRELNILNSNIVNEANARTAADSALQTNITNEATARTNADNALTAAISDEATARNNAIAAARVDAVTDSDTTHSPTGNAVFDAIAAIAPRAWANFDGRSGGTIRKSRNITSITRTATGTYDVVFATAMPDANYIVMGGGAQQSGPQPTAVFVKLASSSAYLSKTVNGFTLGVADMDSGSDQDGFDVNFVIFG